MAILNNVCLDCKCLEICEVYKKVSVFSEEAKKQLGMDVEIKNCKNFMEETGE